jgi:hypothetical protein
MTIDFLRTADYLQEELQTFFRILRHAKDTSEIQIAIERLQAAVNRVEPLSDDPGEAWKDLAINQRWGYLRVLSHLGTATHELQKTTRRGGVVSSMVSP